MPVAIDGRAAVDRVHAVGVEVVGEPRGAADAGDEHDVLAAEAQLGQEALHGREHGVVAAAGAPADLLVGGELLARSGAASVVGTPSTPERRPGKGSSVDSVGHDVSLLGRERWQVDLDALGLGDQAADRVGELGGLERQAADLVVADRVDEVLGAQQQRELAEVHLGHQHLVVALEDLAEVLGERVEVAQVHLRHVVAGLADAADAGADRAVRRAPADHQHLAPRPDGSSTSSGGSDVGDPVDLGLAGPDHQVVVGRVVGDVAVALALLEAADAVLEAGGAGDRPGPRQGLLVAQVGPEVLVARAAVGSWLGSVAKSGSMARQVVDLGDPPRLGAVGEVAVGEQHHRRAVGDRDPGRLEGGVEAVAGDCGATIGTGASPLRPNIACSRSACSVLVGRPVEGPPRWTSIDDQRQLGHHRQADRLGLQRDARARGGGDAEASRRRRRRSRRRCRRSRPRPGTW